MKLWYLFIEILFIFWKIKWYIHLEKQRSNFTTYNIITIFPQVYSLYRYKFKFTFTIVAIKKKKNENVVQQM